MLNIYSWNINGIRALIKKNAWDEFLSTYNPDILCLQEIKASANHLEDVDIKDYFASWNPADKPGYSGTGILSKVKPLKVYYGFSDEIIKKYKLVGDSYGDPAKEGRVIAAEFEDCIVCSVYTPNAKEDLSRLELKHKQWDPAFLAYVKYLENIKPLIVAGDINVAHTEDDLANPKPNVGKKGFTSEERQGFQTLLDNGFIDSFRLFHRGNGYYTWWSHFAKSRERNVGWRIDYMLASKILKDKIKDAQIYPKQMGSDHCPISLTLDL